VQGQEEKLKKNLTWSRKPSGNQIKSKIHRTERKGGEEGEGGRSPPEPWRMAEIGEGKKKREKKGKRRGLETLLIKIGSDQPRMGPKARPIISAARSKDGLDEKEPQKGLGEWCL